MSVQVWRPDRQLEDDFHNPAEKQWLFSQYANIGDGRRWRSVSND